MLSITDFNYHQYKKILEVLLGFIHDEAKKNIPAEEQNFPNPIAILERWEQDHMDRAKKALKIGLMDILSSFEDAGAEHKSELDKLLRGKKLPGFYEILNHAWDIREKVLKKKKIRNLDEYYAIQEELSRVDGGLDESQLEILSEAIRKFEVGKKF